MTSRGLLRSPRLFLGIHHGPGKHLHRRQQPVSRSQGRVRAIRPGFQPLHRAAGQRSPTDSDLLLQRTCPSQPESRAAIRLGRLEPRDKTFVEKGIDIAIAVDMLSMAFHDAYDTAVLVSSDGDFVKVIEAVRDLGKHVEVACFRKAYHVKQAADKVIELNQSFLAPLWMKR